MTTSTALPEAPPTLRSRLNVGGGKGHPRLPNWTIVDLRDSADLQLDISAQPLPYPDASVDIVFTSHTLEHILPQRLGHVLSEFRRVLKPGRLTPTGFQGGILRILVPDISKAIAAYTAGNREFFEKVDLTYRDRTAPLGGLLASWFYSISSIGNGHCHCFDAEYLAHLLKHAGFTHTLQTPFRMSIHPELRSEHLDKHPHESLCMDAWVQPT